MTTMQQTDRRTYEESLPEKLLAETAVRVELPPSWHQRAVQRYEAVREYIERPNSPLHDRVERFYPQGSMAIGATIRTRKRETGYDIDIVAELRLPIQESPETVLDLLHRAIKGDPGSRYHGKVERQTRCVTVHYEDGMHLDVTPAILQDADDPRRSWIFHAKPGKPREHHSRLTVNSYAFAEWFKERTPIDLDFAESYRRRAVAHDQLVHLADADADPVPGHSSDNGGKSATVVALQLLKRNRNVLYRTRHGQRMPPSVLLSCIAGRTTGAGSSIGAALEAISGALLEELSAADRAGELIDVRNPRCEADRFADRWPENFAAQRQYLDDLRIFRQKLARLLTESSLADKAEVLQELFGEAPARSVTQDYADELGAAVTQGTRGIGRAGRILAGAGAAAGTRAGSASSPRDHTFFGGDWR
ncbi:MAG: nucleotidyltransferase [Spiribacter salinus]|uniref:Nucleotidyltransferase n=1 Tax=Spiribacter salinus TaxID=1335746 RepID=A0A540VPK6_9GAMM|nr:MAG: nucleotidyltransferase [Spiribacter salinus]